METSDIPDFKVPFEQRVSTLRYTRRIEGVMEPDKMSDPLHRTQKRKLVFKFIFTDLPFIAIIAPRPQYPISKLKHKLDYVLFK